MPTTISDNGASIKLIIGTQTRNIIKAHIVEIAVIKTNIIKLDSIMGALYNIYIPYGDVTSPATANPEALRDTLITFLPSIGGGIGTLGGATEDNQNLQIEILNNMGTELLSMKDLLIGLDGKFNGHPLIIEDKGAGIGIVYKGYSVLGALYDDPLWAIQRIERSGNITKFKWANGTKKMESRWVLRETLTYL